MWFCILGAFLMAIGMMHGLELVGLPLEADPDAVNATADPGAGNAAASRSALAGGWWGANPSAVVLFTSTTSLVGVFVAGLVFTLRTRPLSESAAARTGQNVRPGRHRLVVALTWITLTAIAVSIPAEVVAQWADLNWGSSSAVARVYAEPDRAGYTAANAYGIFFLLACITVPMRWRESLRIAGPGLLLLAACIALGLVPPWQTTLGLVLMGLAYTVAGSGWSAWRYADFDSRLRAHALSGRYRDLSGEVSEISAELKEARRLHESLFPPAATGSGETSPGAVASVWVDYRYQPARQIGGDFLFVHRESPTGAATVVVIDVSGHGVAAALAVNRLHGELLRFFSHYPGAVGEAGGPGHLLTDLNTYACAALATQGVYATALVVRIDPAASRLAWASAGHPTGFLLRSNAQGTEQLFELGSTATMLGVLPTDDFSAEEHATGTTAGDRLLLYTDGAIESRDAQGHDYTPERLRTAFAVAAGRDGTLLDHLQSEIESHRHGRITDDTLIVEVSVRPSPSLQRPRDGSGAPPVSERARG